MPFPFSGTSPWGGGTVVASLNCPAQALSLSTDKEIIKKLRNTYVVGKTTNSPL